MRNVECGVGAEVGASAGLQRIEKGTDTAPSLPWLWLGGITTPTRTIRRRRIALSVPFQIRCSPSQHYNGCRRVRMPSQACPAQHPYPSSIGCSLHLSTTTDGERNGYCAQLRMALAWRRRHPARTIRRRRIALSVPFQIRCSLYPTLQRIQTGTDAQQSKASPASVPVLNPL